MLDDDNEKIRRNLVFASSLIIILFWLGVGENVLIEKLIGNQIALTSWKVSTLFIAILTYLSLRYRFAEATKKDFARLLGEWNEIRTNKIERRINQLLESFSKTQKDTDIFTPTLSAYYKTQATDKLLSDREDWNLIAIRLASFRPKYGWIGDINVDIELGTDDGQTRNSGGGNNSISYSFVGLERKYLTAISLLKLLTYTRGAVDFVAPILLAVTAFLILCCGLLAQIPFEYIIKSL